MFLVRFEAIVYIISIILRYCISITTLYVAILYIAVEENLLI